MAEFMELHKQNHEKNNSAGMLHQYPVRQDKQPMTGLLQKRTEQTGEGKMREIFRMGNAYGNVALGVNDRQEYTLLANKTGRANGVSVRREERELNEQRAVAFHNSSGRAKLNSGIKSEGAFAFRTKEPDVRTNALVRAAGNAAGQLDAQAAFEQMPFLEEKKQQQTLKGLEQAQRAELEKHRGSAFLSSIAKQKETLKQEKSRTEKERARMLRGMRQAMLLAKKKEGQDVKIQFCVQKKKKRDEEDKKDEGENKK